MKNNGGFIGRILLLVVAVIALKYFLDFDIIEYFRSQEFRDFIQPFLNLLLKVYNWIDAFVRNIVGK